MRPWLLLASLLVSDLSPLGDGDWVMENHSWSLYRKLLLNGQMTPKGLEILPTQNEHHCICILRHCVYVAVQPKQRTPSFYWASIVHNDQGCSFSHRESTAIIRGNHIPALVVSFLYREEKSAPAFLVMADTVPALHVMSEITPSKAGGETSHMVDIIKDHPDSGSAWLLHYHKTALGHSFKAFLLEKSKSWAPATIVQLQNMLTKRCCSVKTVIISCCLKKGEIRSALRMKEISKQQMAHPKIRQIESTRRATNIKVLSEYNGQRPSKAGVSQRDIFQAAALHLGSSPMKTSDTSQLEIRRHAVRIIKKNEHLNSDEESLLQKSVQRQRSLKAASSVYDDDGFYVKRQLLLVSREKTGSINRMQHEMRATQGHNKEDLSGKIITKKAAFRHQGEESETEQSHTNTTGNGNQKGLAYARRADSIHKADNNDVNHKQKLSVVGEEGVLITFFPADIVRETQTEPSSQRTLASNTVTSWKTVYIPIEQLDDPLLMTKVIKGNFITEPDISKCQSLKESLELKAQDSTERKDIKPAESAAKVTTLSYTEEQVKETMKKLENTGTNNAPPGRLSINHTKQEENVSSKDSVIPSLKLMETETAKTERIEETTTVTMEIKETTSSMEVSTQGSTEKAVRLPGLEETPKTTASTELATATEPRFTEQKAAVQATTQKSFFGLRMREDVPADMTKLHEDTENDERVSTNRQGNEKKEDQSDPNVNSLTLLLQTIHKQATDKLPKTTDKNMPLCRGLIHRTDAGRKHCMERFAGTGSKLFFSRDPTDASKDTGKQENASIRESKDNPLNDDEYDHFYYFDGVLRRVQNNFYPYYRRQRRRKRSYDNTEKSVLTERKRRTTHENLLSYIHRLALRNKDSHFK